MASCGPALAGRQMTEVMNAQAEGDDIPEPPVRCYLYGNGYASIDGALSMSAFGPGALRTIARKLLALGYEPDRVLDIHRGGKRTARVLLGDAAQQGE
jgi:hypothetical protein